LQPDTFEIVATIRRLERQRSIFVGASVIGAAVAGMWIIPNLDAAYAAAWAVIALIGIWNIYETKSTRIDVFRASLRNVLIARNPSIVHSADWGDLI